MTPLINRPDKQPTPVHTPAWIKLLAKAAGGIVVLIAVFYLTEYSRGKRAWEQYAAELEAKGFPAYWTMPKQPETPEDQNFATTRLLKSIGLKGQDQNEEWTQNKSLVPKDLSSFLGDYYLSKPYDFLEYSQAAALIDDPNDTNGALIAARRLLEDLACLDKEMNELIQASTRPVARFILPPVEDPMQLAIPNFVNFRFLAQVFTSRASAHLALGQEEFAAQDLRVIHRLGESMSSQTLVEAMIGCAIQGLEIQVFWEGWAGKRWTQEQLTTIRDQFLQVDAPARVYQSLVNGEACWMATHLLKLKKPFLSMFRQGFLSNENDNSWQNSACLFLDKIFPRGWVYQNVLYCSRWEHRLCFSSYSPEQHLFTPSQAQAAAVDLENDLKIFHPFRFLARIAVPNFTKANQRTAFNQTMINQAAIVCALELHHRTVGKYPDTLEALAPKFIARLPKDMIGGEPLRYRLTADGHFQLYSIGWNEKDDGGQRGPNNDYVGQGDWVWPWPTTGADH
jgi:hypothetical protein